MSRAKIMQNPTFDVGKITENLDYVIEDLKTRRSDQLFEILLVLQGK